MKVCVAGELLWDHHADAALDVAQRFTRVVGGAAANVARALALAGADVSVLGVVGDDVLGRGLVDVLRGLGIDTSAVMARPGQTGSVFIGPFVAGGQRFYSYRPTTSWPTRLRLPRGWRRGSLDTAHLHVAALSPGEITPMKRLVEAVHERGARVSIDLNARPRAWRGVRGRRAELRAMLGRATWVKASDDDLRVLGLAPTRDALGLSASATLIVTRGAQALSLVSAGGEVRIRPPRAPVCASIGAGDAFSAALVGAGWPESLQQQKRVVRAACAAAVVHLQRGLPK